MSRPFTTTAAEQDCQLDALCLAHGTLGLELLPADGGLRVDAEDGMLLVIERSGEQCHLRNPKGQR